jgi:2-dehydropantoate 2-reductase
MDLTIVGAGAIGGTVGAYLTRAGIPVRLVDRDLDHVSAMRSRGLTIRGSEETFTVSVDALSPQELSGQLDVVLLAVKAQHTAEAIGTLLPLLAPDSAVVSLQNGLCERVIADYIGAQRTIGCFVNFSADYLEPGLITFAGPDSFYLGELDGRQTPRLIELQRVLTAWGPITITDNIWGYLWAKMGYANMLFATALADETMADLIDRFRPLMAELATEIYEVADREGVRPERFDEIDPSLFYPRERRDPVAVERAFDGLVALRRRNLKQKSGIWRDLAVRHRKTEVDEQIGLAASIGEGHLLPMALTRRLVGMIYELEDGRRPMSWDNVEELESLRLSLSGRIRAGSATRTM